jgi:flagellar assembly protein FliH
LLAAEEKKMKSSRSLNPPQQVQSWLPTDFMKNLAHLGAVESEPSGEAKPLFSPAKPGLISDHSNGSLLKAEAGPDVALWMPTEFSQPRPEKPAQTFQPVIRYNTAANATEVATQIILDAKKQAEEFMRLAELQAKSLHEQAYQQGLQEGMDEIHFQIDASKKLVEETIHWRDEMMAQSEPMVLDFIRAISQKLFGEGFVLDPAMLQATFNNILENARSLGNLRIYVNPEDSLLLGPYWRELQESITAHKVEVIPSSSISRGGCYVNGQWGSADGRIETQLKAIMDTLVPDQDQKDEGKAE